VLEHLRSIVAAAKVPVNADFEGGYAVGPQHVAENVKLAAGTGIAGLSIEDSTGDEIHPLTRSSTSPRSSPLCRPNQPTCWSTCRFITVAEAVALGVRRISVGGTLARTAWAGFLQAATEIADAGTLSRFDQLPNVDRLFRDR